MRKQFVIRLLVALALCCGLIAHPALQAQTTTPPAPGSYHVNLRYLKVEPGKQEDWAKIIPVWTKVMQARKDKGEIRSWSMFKRCFPAGTGSTYDYISVMAFNDLNQLETYDGYKLTDWSKGLSKEDAALLENSNNVRKLVERTIFQFNGSLADGKRGKYLQLIGTEIVPGHRKDYLTSLEKTGAIAAEAMKAGKITNRSTWERITPNNASLSDFVVVFDYATLAQALTGLDFAEEHAKIYPNDDQAAFWEGMNKIRQVLWTEIWERVDGTKEAGAETAK